MSPYAIHLARARLDALRQLVAALHAAETPDEKRRCAVAILSAPEPCDLDDEVELVDHDCSDEETKRFASDAPPRSHPDPAPRAHAQSSSNPASALPLPTRAASASPVPIAPSQDPPLPRLSLTNILDLLAPLDLGPAPNLAPETPVQQLLARAGLAVRPPPDHLHLPHTALPGDSPPQRAPAATPWRHPPQYRPIVAQDFHIGRTL